MIVTTASAALNELVQTMGALVRLYDDVRGRDPTNAEDSRLSQLEERRSALEAQLRREVTDKLGVDYAVLWNAVQP